MNMLFRQIDTNDYPFLQEMLYEAIFVPEGEEPFPKSIIDLPEIAKYIENWGDKGDFGLIIQCNNQPVGAIWCRLYTEDHKGYGFVDAYTPEVSIALKAAFRNQGFGTQMMEQTFMLAKENGYKALSLSVDKRNRAASLYIRMGFEIVDDGGTDYKMKKEL
jgi:[ribosomal protein S18]-alanine N-acetyltransferase